ncbi:MAG: hypothetical protein ABI823_18825 [Bryobacteraceae bacterium]
MREKLLLIAVTLVTFGATLLGSFHFDDYALLSDRVITAADGWWRAWMPLQTRPLTWFTFWANFQVGGPPVVWHAVNLGLHCACVLAAYSALRRILGGRTAWVAAALFAVHPIAAEPVAYVSARGTLLAALFCLLSLRSWLAGSRWTAVAYFAAALLGKEECAAFPVFLLALHWSVSKDRKELPPIAAMFALSLAAGLRVIWASTQVAGSGVGQSAGITAAGYLSAQGVVILRYLRMLVLPYGFTPDPEITTPGAWVSIVAWLAVGCAAAIALRWSAKARAGFWFLGGLILLAPSSSIFPAADLAADRRMYLPLVAFAACAALWLSQADQRIALALIASLGLISIRQSMIWRTEESLWTEAVRLAPSKIRPRIQLARALPWHRAIVVLEEAKRIAPEDPELASEEGRVHLSAARPELALQAFGRALAMRPGDAKAFNNRGAALLALGQNDAAQSDFEAALRRDPCLLDARRNLRTIGFDDRTKYPWPASCSNAP